MAIRLPRFNNGHDTMQDYFWDGLRDDPWEGVARLHTIAKGLQEYEELDFADQADDLDDAADELEQLLDRIAATFEDDIGYDKDYKNVEAGG